MQRMGLERVDRMNDLTYIFSWLLIVVGFGIGWYMGFPRSNNLTAQRLQKEARYSKYIGYTYMFGSVVAIIAYRI